jgi:hypothetical protein
MTEAQVIQEAIRAIRQPIHLREQGDRYTLITPGDSSSHPRKRIGEAAGVAVGSGHQPDVDAGSLADRPAGTVETVAGFVNAGVVRHGVGPVCC